MGTVTRPTSPEGRPLDRNRWPTWYATPLVVAGLLIAVSWLLWRRDVTITEENRLMENLQVLFLLLGVGFHLLRCCQAEALAARLGHVCLGLLCLSLAARELDLREVLVAPFWRSVEFGSRVVLGIGWVLLSLRVLLKTRQLWPQRGSMLLSTTSGLTAVAVALYLTSWFFDKQVFPINKHLSQFIEESIQLTASLYYFTAALKPLP